MEYKNKKKRSLKRFLNSFKFAFQGLKYAFVYEQNMFVHIIVTVWVVILGLLFHISLFEWLFCLVIIGLVIATELINTAIEAVVDLVTVANKPLAKIAKDTASAAVFVFAVIAFLCGLIIFIPKILELF
ncbi:MAG: diacylglycerol kinase family protein [Bacilli bacterium]